MSQTLIIEQAETVHTLGGYPQGAGRGSGQ